MVSLKKLPSVKKTSLSQQLNVFLAEVFLKQQLINPKLVIALSGGLDSSVLLHILVTSKQTLPFQLQAHHVHHGLSSNADSWANFCVDVCKKLNVPLTISKVNVNKNSGSGLEAAAREMRYNALLTSPVGSEADLICLAHHQDDQAETLLLQLARGAGVKGLAGMLKQHKKLLRPLLDVPRSTLENYASQHQLAWVEDESNVNTKFDRNFVRHEVLPTLAKQYPAIKQTISRSAQHMAEASMLLDEIAALDVENCLQDTVLNLQSFQQLSAPRIKNALRWWLIEQGCDLPSAAQLQQITQQLLHAKADAAVKIKVSDKLTLQRYRDSAFLVTDKKLPEPINLLWQGEEVIYLPDHSRLVFSQIVGEGFALHRNGLLNKHVKLRIKNREGGERFKPELGRPSRNLKTILQTSEMPPWQRDQLPLIFMDETLVIIPNIGVDANFQAANHEIGLQVAWEWEYRA